MAQKPSPHSAQACCLTRPSWLRQALGSRGPRRSRRGNGGTESPEGDGSFRGNGARPPASRGGNGGGVDSKTIGLSLGPAVGGAGAGRGGSAAPFSGALAVLSHGTTLPDPQSQ